MNEDIDWACVHSKLASELRGLPTQFPKFPRLYTFKWGVRVGSELGKREIKDHVGESTEIWALWLPVEKK